MVDCIKYNEVLKETFLHQPRQPLKHGINIKQSAAAVSTLGTI